MERFSVTKQMTQRADRQVREAGPRPAMVKLSNVEPELIEFVNRGMDRVSRMLDKGTGKEAERGQIYCCVLRLVIAALESQRSAHASCLTRLLASRVPEPGDANVVRPSVTASRLEAIEDALWPIGREKLMEELATAEPELHRFVLRVEQSVQDALAEHELSHSESRAVSEQLMSMAAICVYALRASADSDT